MPLLQELLEPWAITQDAFRVVVERTKALMARDAAPVAETCNVSMRGDVAILHVKGPLFRYHSWITSYLGSSSYGEMRKDLQKILDAGVQALLVVSDSPGGEVNGMVELADAFFAARARIPNTAVYVSGAGASAAYLLCGAAGKIYCSPTALVGSIGIITSIVDYTKAMAEAGITEYELVSSQSPKKSQQPADASYRARVQSRIDDMAEVFIGRVAQYRAVSTADVIKKYGQGDVLVGQRAVDAGLADAVSDVESVIAELQSRVDRAKPKATATTIFPMKGAIKMDAVTMARRLGLEESASEKQIEDRALALSNLVRDLVVASGAKSEAELLGTVRAGSEAIVARDTLQTQLKAQGDESVQREFRAAMKDAFKDGRLTLGEAAKILPFMKDEEAAKAKAALDGLKEQSRKEVLSAICQGRVSPGRLKNIKAYLDLCKPNAATPAAKTEPENTDGNRAQVSKVTDEQIAQYARETGVSRERAAALLATIKSDSVDDYLRAIEKTQPSK